LLTSASQPVFTGRLGQKFRKAAGSDDDCSHGWLTPGDQQQPEPLLVPAVHKKRKPTTVGFRPLTSAEEALCTIGGWNYSADADNNNFNQLLLGVL
jgi:hypothetical protein